MYVCMYKFLLIFCSFQVLWLHTGPQFYKENLHHRWSGIKPRILVSFSGKRGILTKCFLLESSQKTGQTESSPELYPSTRKKEKNKILVSKHISCWTPARNIHQKLRVKSKIIFWSNLEIENMAYTYITVLFDIIWFLFRNSSKNLKGSIKVEKINNRKKLIIAEFDYYWFAPILSSKKILNPKKRHLLSIFQNFRTLFKNENTIKTKPSASTICQLPAICTYFE